MEEEYEHQEAKEQTSLQRNRTCTVHIFQMTQLTEKKVVIHGEGYLQFVELTYNTVPLKKLWQVMERSVLVRVIFCLYSINTRNTPPHEIQAFQSPCMFHSCMYYVDFAHSS